nr:MAG TPA: hypothetical protein [Bacteriophage sp.]
MYTITTKDVPKIAHSYEFVDLNKMDFLKGAKSTPFKPIEIDGFRIHTLQL